MKKVVAPRWRRWVAPVCAFLLALGVQLLALQANGDAPFGQRSRNVSDFGTQYLPFHAQFRRILAGDHSLSSFWFTWTGGGGVPFLPDYAYYLGGPLTPLVRLFPLTQVETAILVISTMRVCLAAATMSLLLQRINTRAPQMLVVLLACGYACSSWVFDTSIYTPMWLDAGWCLPLALLAMHWCLERRHPVLAIVVVALTVWCNFYTAVMVCFGCLVYLLGLLVQHGTRPREVLWVFARAGRAMALGWTLMAWMLVPTLKALGTSVPVPPAGVPEVMHGIAQTDYWPRLLPLTEGYATSPAMCIGSVGLVLAASLPCALATPRRTRFTWSVVLVLVLVLSNTSALLWVWNAFDVPQGNHFRFSFVLCAFLVIAAVHAWPSTVRRGRDGGVPSTTPSPGEAPGATAGTSVSLPHWPGAVQLAGAGILIGVLCWQARPHYSMHLSVGANARWFVLAAWGLWCVGGLVMRLSRARARSVVAGLMLALLGALWVVETVQGAVFTQDVLRHRLGTMPLTSGSRGIYHSLGRRATTEAGWPLHRAATVGAATLPRFSYYNQGALLGMPTVGYYSSNMPVLVSRAYSGLGAFTDLHGRMMREVDTPAANDPVLAALVSVSNPREMPGPALPMVREFTGQTRGISPNVFDNRNALLGVDVYSPAGLQMTGATPAGGQPINLAAGARANFTITCAPTAVPTLQFDRLHGTVDAGHGWRHGYATAAMVQLPAGTRTVQVSTREQTQLVAASCLDAEALHRAVGAAVAPEHLQLPPGRIIAHFAHPVTGTIMVSSVDQPGWSCSGNGTPLHLGSNAGFLAIDARSTTDLQCHYREPGLLPGAGGSLLALAGVCSTGWLARRRDRREATSGTSAVGAETRSPEATIRAKDSVDPGVGDGEPVDGGGWVGDDPAGPVSV